MQRRWQLFTLCPSAAAVLSFATSLAWAQGPPASPSALPAADMGAPRSDDAQTQYKKAGEAYESGRYVEAVDILSRLCAVKKAPEIVGNLGRAEFHAGKFRDAAEHLGLFRRTQDNIAPEELAEVTSMLAMAKTKIGTLRVEADRRGADIRIDGVRVGAAPIVEELYVDPGRHTIEARIGKLESTARIDAPAGSSQTVRLTLTPPPLPPLLQPRPFPVLQVTGLALSGAVMIAGGVSYGIAVDYYNRLRVPPPQLEGGSACLTIPGSKRERGHEVLCNEVRAMHRDAPTFQTLGLFLLGAGGVGIAALTPLLIIELTRPQSGTSSRLAPAIGPNGAGLVWQGSF